ncbi:MAG: hypothetical protein A2557_13665 [Candidatus Lambdaproteobacteria bacterium RIFOXYD2_FULL_56_26]|uniref:Uncharacterized protein n=1 Tax=Candidatus Lambdaproteobacteria bacterium RIFOXYD2_FULL_56_26 TaxID=1817773 RepID=A0A1F6H062_9PROT|nr:MAG: hypothetical protein A2557_13665 [Candidatus Lambdaproteobacteria bacterium RIFOXYD2_FULL_56_26]
MKHLGLLLCLTLFLPWGARAELGAFFANKSTYGRTELNGGQKKLIPAKSIYPVVALEVAEKNHVLYRLLYPDTSVSTGSGFIVETDQELQEKKEGLIKVYKEVPNKKTDLTQFTWVPLEALLVTGRLEQSPDFPNLVFRAANYKGQLPLQLWVEDWAGIYRPDKDANYLTLTWAMLEQMQISRGKKQRILMGLVETGFSKDEVKLALGAPLKEEPLPSGELQWLYPDKKVIFLNGQVVRVL